MSALRICLVPVLISGLSAATYKQEDRDAAVELLEQTVRELSISLETVNLKQEQFAPIRWSILQILEHLALAEDFLFGALKQAIEKSKPVPDSQQLQDPSPMDRFILIAIVDRSQKAKAPEQAMPKGNYRNRDEAFETFSIRRQKTVAFLQDTKLDLRRYFVESPMGNLDLHQWLLMMAAHTQRHIAQLNELKSHEQYPK